MTDRQWYIHQARLCCYQNLIKEANLMLYYAKISGNGPLSKADLGTIDIIMDSQ